MAAELKSMAEHIEKYLKQRIQRNFGGWVLRLSNTLKSTKSGLGIEPAIEASRAGVWSIAIVLARQQLAQRLQDEISVVAVASADRVSVKLFCGAVLLCSALFTAATLLNWAAVLGFLLCSTAGCTGWCPL